MKAGVDRSSTMEDKFCTLDDASVDPRGSVDKHVAPSVARLVTQRVIEGQRHVRECSAEGLMVSQLLRLFAEVQSALVSYDPRGVRKRPKHYL